MVKIDDGIMPSASACILYCFFGMFVFWPGRLKYANKICCSAAVIAIINVFELIALHPENAFWNMEKGKWLFV